ncbi:MAG TPA: hypothetical protein VD735_03055 [Candidatus Saccharimonadales bacterium]|nr:hypothetical protein [Candidatus Saccharimonadales bacterium]
MGQNAYKAAGLKPNRREFQAGIGVRFQVARTDQVRGFFRAADRELAQEGRAPTHVIPNNHGHERERDQFTLYDDYDRMGITVIERRATGARAKKAPSGRRNWNMHDVGRVRSEVGDVLADLRQAYELPLGSLTMQLTNMVTVGSPSGRREDRGDRKFALVPPPDDTTAAFLAEANEAVGTILDNRLGQTDTPYEYTPKLTIARIHNTVPLKQAAACGDALGAIIAKQPLTIMLTDQHIFDYHSFRQPV